VYWALNQQERNIRTQRPSSWLGILIPPSIQFGFARRVKQGARWPVVARDNTDPPNPTHSLHHYKNDWKVVFTNASSCS
jgi:hypothetical protein